MGDKVSKGVPGLKDYVAGRPAAVVTSGYNRHNLRVLELGTLGHIVVTAEG